MRARIYSREGHLLGEVELACRRHVDGRAKALTVGDELVVALLEEPRTPASRPMFLSGRLETA